ncbi:MAG TPA: redoxin domain-containing protein [Chloroflexia bacterium]|nr:redoxin domain-containing protein [Chloroflexia bacterium]
MQSNNTPPTPGPPGPPPPYTSTNDPRSRQFVGSAPFYILLGVLSLAVLCVIVSAAVILFVGVTGARDIPVQDSEMMPATSTPSRTGDRSTGARVGAFAPDFTLTDAVTGESVSLASLRGKPVWINFWATWCPPCREEMPEMQQYYEKYHAQGLAIVGVNVQESDSQVQQYLKEGAYTWTFVLDAKGTTTDRYLVGGLPSHFFIDAEGVVQAIHMGGLENMAGRKAPVEEYLAKIMKSP